MGLEAALGAGQPPPLLILEDHKLTLLAPAWKIDLIKDALHLWGPWLPLCFHIFGEGATKPAAWPSFWVVAGLAIEGPGVSTALGVSTAMGVFTALALVGVALVGVASVGLLGLVGFFGVLKDKSGAFWQLDPFVISLPNWPENRPMFDIKQAHCLTFCPKAFCCSSVSGPESRIPLKMVLSTAAFISFLRKSLYAGAGILLVEIAAAGSDKYWHTSFSKSWATSKSSPSEGPTCGDLCSNLAPPTLSRLLSMVSTRLITPCLLDRRLFIVWGWTSLYSPQALITWLMGEYACRNLSFSDPAGPVNLSSSVPHAMFSSGWEKPGRMGWMYPFKAHLPIWTSTLPPEIPNR